MPDRLATDQGRPDLDCYQPPLALPSPVQGGPAPRKSRSTPSLKRGAAQLHFFAHSIQPTDPGAIWATAERYLDGELRQAGHIVSTIQGPGGLAERICRCMRSYGLRHKPHNARKRRQCCRPLASKRAAAARHLAPIISLALAIPHRHGSASSFRRLDMESNTQDRELFEAVWQDDLAEVARQLAAGANPNAADSEVTGLAWPGLACSAQLQHAS